MNNQQAKELLALFRPGKDDAQDPEFAGALRLAREDPELGRWFDLHCQAREAIRAKFKDIPVPEGLKEQILAERKVHTTPFVRRPASVLALAVAALVLVAGLTVLWRPTQENRFASFQNRMVSTVVRAYPRMDLETNDLGQIQRYLAQHQAPGDYLLPAGLAKTRGTGCAILPWNGRPVSMICFNSGKTAGSTAPDLFLFVIDRTAVPDGPQAGPPQVTRIKHLATASWISGDKIYVLATSAAGSIDEYL
jgi:hypothetical protein